MRHFGRSLRRLEDRRLVTGRGGFTAETRLAGELAMAVVRSPVASGVLRQVDPLKAFELPGVHAVWTAEDVAGLPPLPAGPGDAFAPYRQPVLGGPQLRYVGEPVAAVFAEDRRTAVDAAELVVLDIDGAAPVLDATRSPTAFDGALNSTEIEQVETGFGAVEPLIGRADRVIDLSLTMGRQGAMPLETRSALARWNPARQTLEFHLAAALGKADRAFLARWLGLPDGGLALDLVPAGGGFGLRDSLHPEDLLVLLAAVRLERPVRWSESRRDHMVASDQGREQHHRARIAAGNDGRILAIETQFWQDQGAYPRPCGTAAAERTAALLPGPYRMDAYRARGRVVLTNKPPAGLLRGAGCAEATFVRERLLDVLAGALGRDPLDLRLQNMVRAVDMPFDRGLILGNRRIVHEAGDYPLLVEKARKRFSLDLLQRRLADRRERGELVGAGFAFFVGESPGSAVAGCRITVDTAGFAAVDTGCADEGDGIETSLAQVVADVIGVPYERIRVRTGVVDLTGWSAPGAARPSREAATTAALLAAERIRTRLLAAASRMMQVEPERLTVTEGRAREADRHFGSALEIGEVVATLEAAPSLRDGDGLSAPGLSAEAWSNADQPAHPYGLHVATVEIDRDTGDVRVPRYFVAFDAGTAIHPQSIEQEIAGGVVQGLGTVLSERFAFDDAGTPLALTLSDYGVLAARDVPDIDVLVTEDSPNPLTPLGLKSASEAGIAAVAAAVAGAIDQALGTPGAVRTLPITPPRIRAILRERRPSGTRHDPADV